MFKDIPQTCARQSYFTLWQPVWQARSTCLTNLKSKDIPLTCAWQLTSLCWSQFDRHLCAWQIWSLKTSPEMCLSDRLHPVATYLAGTWMCLTNLKFQEILYMCLVPGGQSARHSCFPSCKRMPRTCRTGELAGLFEGKTILLTMLSLSQLMLSKWSPNLNHSCANI